MRARLLFFCAALGCAPVDYAEPDLDVPWRPLALHHDATLAADSAAETRAGPVVLTDADLLGNGGGR